MTDSPTLSLILALAILVGGGWLVWRGPTVVLRAVTAVVVLAVALAACGALVIGGGPSAPQ